MTPRRRPATPRTRRRRATPSPLPPRRARGEACSPGCSAAAAARRPRRPPAPPRAPGGGRAPRVVGRRRGGGGGGPRGRRRGRRTAWPRGGRRAAAAGDARRARARGGRARRRDRPGRRARARRARRDRPGRRARARRDRRDRRRARPAGRGAGGEGPDRRARRPRRRAPPAVLARLTPRETAGYRLRRSRTATRVPAGRFAPALGRWLETTRRPRAPRGRSTSPRPHFDRASAFRAWATVRPRSRGTTHRTLLVVVPPTDWAGAGAGAAAGAGAGAGAGTGGTGAATGLGTGGGLCRSGAATHVAAAGNGASGAPPAAPVAGSCLKQSTARPLALVTTLPDASVFSPSGTNSSGWSNGADAFFTRGSVSASRNATRSFLSCSLRFRTSRFGLFSALAKSPPRL